MTAWMATSGAPHPLEATSYVARAASVAISAAVENGAIAVRSSGWGLEPANVAFTVTGSGVTRWYQAYHQDDGRWTANIAAGTDFSSSGSFDIDAYATFGSATARCSSTQIAVSAGTVNTDAKVESGRVSVDARGWSLSPGNVAFAVAGPTGVVEWYQAIRQLDGSWGASLSVLALSGSGTYQIETWATFGRVTSRLTSKSVTFELPAVKLDTLVSGAQMDFIASEWPEAPNNVAFAVTLPNGATRWLQGIRQDDGSWTASSSATREFKQWGVYRVSLWATVGNRTLSVSSRSLRVTMGDIKVEAGVDEGNLHLSVSEWTLQASNVAFEVRLSSGNTVWLQAIPSSDGSWTASAATSILGAQHGTVRIWATYDGYTDYISQMAF